MTCAISRLDGATEVLYILANPRHLMAAQPTTEADGAHPEGMEG